MTHQTDTYHLDSIRISRRTFQRTALAGLSASTLAQALWTAESQAQDETIGRNRFPRMVQEHYVARVRSIADRRQRRIDQLQTREDAEKYVAEIRQRITFCFGSLPEKTPLNARVTSSVDRDQYRIDNVIFESRPGFLVTANLYVPKTDRKLSPGVVGTCGHSTNGKAAGAYQSFAQGLARQGYFVLIYDPIGQGERLQYTNEELQSRVGVGVREHLMAGNQQFLVNEFLGTWRAWDGIRALDYLLTVPGVDPEQVGVTGNSGGGTMTTWLAGVEQRWSMAAPSCFVTTFLNNLENELPADTEQCPPNALGMGLEHEDFLAALAPRPVIILAKERDFFDVRGSETALGRLKKIWKLLGAEDQVSLFTGPTSHGYSQENREAMYGWFNRATGLSDNSAEPELTMEPDETLWCAPQGQVATLKSRTVMEFTRERAQQLAERRRPLDAERLQQYLARLLRLRGEIEVPAYRILRPHSDRAYPRQHASVYALETDRGIQTLVYRLAEERLLSRPSASESPAVLYVSHHSADRELAQDEWVQQQLTAQPDAVWYACDVRGVGESRPNTCGENSFLAPYGCDYFYAIHGIMLGDPYLAQKTRDLLGTLAWLRSIGHKQIHVCSQLWGTLPTTFGAVIDGDLASVTLKQPLESYLAVAEADEYDWPLSSLLPGVLNWLDLPDLYKHLESGKLSLIDPVGARLTAEG